MSGSPVSKAVVVLGVARSGTSMAAGICSCLGVDMGEADNPNDTNPRGAFENPEFLELTTVLHAAKVERRDAYIYNVQARDLCEKHSKGRRLWGFKSAVTHHCLDTFIRHLHNPHLVVTWRNPLHVAQSWMKLNEAIYGNEHIDLRWATESMLKDAVALAACLQAYRELPIVETTYEELKQEPVAVARRIAKALKVKVTSKMRQRIERFILSEYSTIS